MKRIKTLKYEQSRLENESFVCSAFYVYIAKNTPNHIQFTIPFLETP